MSIRLEVELLMPPMPTALAVKSVRRSKLDYAHDHLKVNVSDLDEEAVEQVCDQWAAEFREWAARQRVIAGKPAVRRSVHYFGADGMEEPE